MDTNEHQFNIRVYSCPFVVDIEYRYTAKVSRFQM